MLKKKSFRFANGYFDECEVVFLFVLFCFFSILAAIDWNCCDSERLHWQWNEGRNWIEVCHWLDGDTSRTTDLWTIENWRGETSGLHSANLEVNLFFHQSETKNATICFFSLTVASLGPSAFTQHPSLSLSLKCLKATGQDLLEILRTLARRSVSFSSSYFDTRPVHLIFNNKREKREKSSGCPLATHKNRNYGLLFLLGNLILVKLCFCSSDKAKVPCLNTCLTISCHALRHHHPLLLWPARCKLLFWSHQETAHRNHCYTIPALAHTLTYTHSNAHPASTLSRQLVNWLKVRLGLCTSPPLSNEYDALLHKE